MKRILFHILILGFSSALIGQNIRQELFNLNNYYTSIESYYTSMKVTYFDATGNEEEVQNGHFTQYATSSLYSLGPYEMLSFGNELVQINNTDSTVVYLKNNTDLSKSKPMDNYLKKINNYLKICNDSSIVIGNGFKEINIGLKHAIENITGLRLKFSNKYILSKMELTFINGEKISFEYYNTEFNKNKIKRAFKRSDYLKGENSNLELQNKYSSYKFNNFSN